MRKSGPPRGLISYLVLELLEEKPRYGYEILKEITEISGGHWEPSYGSVYPILYKFEEEGWAERVERADEPDRKYFELTDAGRDHLAEKRVDTGGKAREFADVILGFYHVYVAFTTDDRFTVDARADGWRFDGDYSAWIAEQVIRHHERDFGPFERIPDTPEEFLARMGTDADVDADIAGETDGVEGAGETGTGSEAGAEADGAGAADEEGTEAVADGPAN